MRLPNLRPLGPGLLFLWTVLAAPARADLVLTSAGSDAGFTLTPFITGFPSTGYCCGPLGAATNSDGVVMVVSYAENSINLYNNLNGQVASQSIGSAPFYDQNYGAALAYTNGHVYASYSQNLAVVELNNDGTIASTVGTGIGKGGLWTNPVNGHLLSAYYGAIYDIDPLTDTWRLVVNADVDGVSVSNDGQTVYGAAYGHVYGWNIASGALTFDSGYIGSPDGTAVIEGSSPLSGNIVANGNDGNVWLINPQTAALTLIASGGSRGDYVGLDHTNGSLFVSQTDSLYRLTCGADCFFTAPNVPEPSTLGLTLAAGLGLAAFGMYRRRRT